ncbi:hypothetical protein R3W88_019410 [Solanum pinnatisectum]|uniref:Uncharacterized protein n=1 Tax=Solanum pinnatisectum TaxID=50273 RepID=A0AAV9KKS9_9SOLN|nr:hypothetical protein R3W88_019410 [Solanum pinnatisectum]
MEVDQTSEISETYTEIMENKKLIENTEVEINYDEKMKETAEPSTRATRTYPKHEKPQIYTRDYTNSDRYNTLWDKRLNIKKWSSKQINLQPEYLNLDCVTNINQNIQLWIGYIAKQIIDNKINMTEVPGYIERTFIGEVKLWFLNLEEESKKTLRSSKDIQAKETTSVMDILYKYETTIRNEFSSMTTEEEERNKNKLTNRNLMNKLGICNMCYLDEYNCAYKEYYYKGVYNTQESPGIRHLHFTKLPEPFSSKIIKAWEEAGLHDTLGARIKFVKQWYANMCENYREDVKMEKTIIKNLACCKDKVAPQFGYDDKYYKKHKKRF